MRLIFSLIRLCSRGVQGFLSQDLKLVRIGRRGKSYMRWVD